MQEKTHDEALQGSLSAAALHVSSMIRTKQPTAQLVEPFAG
jgi:hypothetical protein